MPQNENREEIAKVTSSINFENQLSKFLFLNEKYRAVPPIKFLSIKYNFMRE
jgi:hypothetical protein